jgi:hypothetical protein
MSIGPDEQRILEALKAPALQERQKRLLQKELRAKYKIEVHFGKDRSISPLKASVGAILIWESGRRFHGGGDEKMYWCGYTAVHGFSADQSCGKPIKSSLFGYHHVVCPHCQRECFLGHDSKKKHIEVARKGGKDVAGLKRMPVIMGEQLFRLPPQKLAAELEKQWRWLDCDADIYCKYHPSDIRYRALEENVKTPDQLERARRLRGLMIYPLKNILKDTLGGASVQNRFLALVTA